MSARSIRLLALVGTDHHPFDRFVDWVDEWLQQQGGEVSAVIQYGTSHAPRHGRGVQMLPREELDELADGADVIICHGGPGTIADARRRRIRPIVIPRQARLGEHVDDHQMLFSERLDSMQLIRRAVTLQQFDACMARALAATSDIPANAGPGERSVGGDFVVDEAIARVGRIVDDLVADVGRRGRPLLRSLGHEQPRAPQQPERLRRRGTYTRKWVAIVPRWTAGAGRKGSAPVSLRGSTTNADHQ